MNLVRLKREQQTVIGAVVVGGLLLPVYWMYLAQPMLRSAMDLQRNVRIETQKLQHIQQLIEQQSQLQHEYDQLSLSMKVLRESMPAEQELASVIEQLSGMAPRAGVKIQTIFPQRSLESLKVVAGLQDKKSTQTRLFKEIPIQIDALAGFHQLGAFLARVERGRQPMVLKSLRVSGNPKEPRRQTIEMVLIAYFAASETKDAARPSAAAAPTMKR